MASSPTAEELLTALEAKLRVLLGSAGTSAASALIRSAISAALLDLTRARPLVDYAVVRMVVGQREYSLPADTYKVLDVVFPSFASGIDTESELDTMFHSHSLSTIIAQKWEQFESLHAFAWEFDVDKNVVRITPEPCYAMYMCVQVGKMRTISDVPVSLQESFEQLATASCLTKIAGTVSNGITSIPIGIGNVTFDASKLLESAKNLRSDAMRKLDVSGGAVIVG